MATAVIKNVDSGKVSSIKQKNFFKSYVSEKAYTSQISYEPQFRVRFTNIGVPGYSANNPAPIGIAIIGVNNYIL